MSSPDKPSRHDYWVLAPIEHISDARQPLLLRPPSPGPRESRLRRTSVKPPPASTISTAASPGKRQADWRSSGCRHSLAGGAGRVGVGLPVVHHGHPRAREGRRQSTPSPSARIPTRHVADHGFRHDEQKRRFVPFLRAGKGARRFGLTEPGAGSDAGGTKTTAVDRGDHYVLNGSKIFITHAGVGEISASRRAPTRTPSAPRDHRLHRHEGHLRSRRDEAGRGRHAPELPKNRGVLSGKKKTSSAARLRHAGADLPGRGRPKENVSAGEQRVPAFLHTRTVAGFGIPPCRSACGGRAGGVPDVYLHPKQFAGPLRASRACISPSPTWRPRSSRQAARLSRAWLKQHGHQFKKERQWRSSISELCMRRRPRRSSCMGATATREYPVNDDAGRKICEIGEGRAKFSGSNRPQLLGGLID